MKVDNDDDDEFFYPREDLAQEAKTDQNGEIKFM